MKPSPARTILLALAIAGVFAVIPLSLLVAPEARNFTAPLTQRIFYYHVPAAWVAYLAFAVTAIAGGMHLARGTRESDRLAHASAEVGLAFSLIALFTGLAWARVEFIGYSPLEDYKVISLVVLILSYFAYLVLRSGVEDPARRGKLAGVFGILAFLGVPLSYLASRASVHPDFTTPESNLGPELGMILGVSVVMFTLLYASLTWERYGLQELADHVTDLRHDREAP